MVNDDACRSPNCMLNVSLFAVLIYMVPINSPSTHAEIPTGRRRHLTRVHRNWRHSSVVIFMLLPFLSSPNQLTQPFFISHPNTNYYLNLHVCFCLHFSFGYNVSSPTSARGVILPNIFFFPPLIDGAQNAKNARSLLSLTEPIHGACTQGEVLRYLQNSSSVLNALTPN